MKFRPSTKNDLVRGFLARLHSWFSKDPTSKSGYSLPECGEQNFHFQADKLSTLEPHHLQEGLSADDSFSKEALSREQRVLTWTNVVDAEEWMGRPSLDTKSVENWSQLLQRIGEMGPNIPAEKSDPKLGEMI